MESGIKDINGNIVKDKDILHFNYEGQAVEATVGYKNGLFGANCKNNDPFSCQLADLKEKVGDFEIVVS